MRQMLDCMDHRELIKAVLKHFECSIPSAWPMSIGISIEKCIFIAQ